MSSLQLADDEHTPLLKSQQVKKTPLPWGQFSLIMVRSKAFDFIAALAHLEFD